MGRLMRVLALLLVFSLGLAVAALWQGRMHHLRLALPVTVLPGWTASVPDAARLREGRMNLAAQGLFPAMTLHWEALWPDLSGWRWQVRLTGAGIGLAGEMQMPFWLATARVTLTSGRVELAPLLPLRGVAGAFVVDGGAIRLRDRPDLPWVEVSLTGRTEGAAAAGVELGAGPAQATLGPEGAWAVSTRLEGGATRLEAVVDGLWPDPAGIFVVTLDDANAIPPGLEALLDGAGRPEGAGWVVEGLLYVF